MTRVEVDEKAFHLMRPLFGAKRARAVCDAVWNIERMNDVLELGRLLRTRPRR